MLFGPGAHLLPPGNYWHWRWASDPEGLALSSLASEASRNAGAWAVTRVAELGRAQAHRRAEEDERRQREQLEAFRQQQMEAAPARRLALPPHAAWVAWQYAGGATQWAIGAQLGVSNATISILVRRYIEAWLPEALQPRPESWGPGPAYISGDSRELLREHFRGRQERQPKGLAWHRMRQRGAAMAAAAAAERERAWYRGRRNLGRPIDMGGPRDRWIEYSLESNSP